MIDTVLTSMAEAWLCGWDAALLQKPESVCPFRDHVFSSLWRRGWEAGCRRETSDHEAKGRFVALSMGASKGARL